MTKRVMTAVMLLGISPQLRPSQLSDLAAQLQPGTFAELQTNNILATLSAGGSSGHIFSYSEELKWDPKTHRLLYVGGDHGDAMRFVWYTEATNTWTVPAQPSWLPQGPNHGYDHMAMDEARGFFYVRESYSGRGFWRFDTATNAWSPMPPNDVLANSQCCGGVDFFPEMDGLVWAQGSDSWDGGGVFIYRESTNQWQRLATNLPIGGYSNFLEYSPVQKVVVFGGGINRPKSIFRMTSAGITTQLGPASIDLGIQSSIVTSDPVSGEFLIFAPNNTFHTFDALTDTWRRQDVTTPLTGLTEIHGIVAAPISTYGVILLVKPELDNFHVYLYKHAPGRGSPVDTVAPTVPTTLKGTAVSPSQIDLTWDTSTDNIALSGYYIYRNYLRAAATHTSSYQDTGLTAATTYTYRVTAFDATGNESPKSASVQTTTKTPDGPPPRGYETPEKDFEARCAAPGVARFFSFDSQALAEPHIEPPWGTTVKKAQVVTDMKASGAGSLRFEVPPISGSDTSGSFHINFSDDLSCQFGEGEEFYVQWRQRFTSEFLDTPYDGGGGWKQVIIGEGDRPGQTVYSCTQLEIAMNNGFYRGFPQMYHSCGQKDGQYESLLIEIQDPDTGTDWVLQNAVDCRRSMVVSSTDKSQYIPPCVGYYANQWMTFQVRVKIGTWYKNDHVYHKDSIVQLWVAEEGQPSKLVIDFSGYDIANNNPAAKYGKIWFTPYNTGKTNAQAYPVAYTWYDELIISRNRIADPAQPGDFLAPAPPQNLRVR